MMDETATETRDVASAIHAARTEFKRVMTENGLDPSYYPTIITVKFVLDENVPYRKITDEEEPPN